MPTAIFVPDIPVKIEINDDDDDDQIQYSNENLHNELHKTSRLNVKIETSDDQNIHSHDHEDDVCGNRTSNRQISRMEESAQPATTSTRAGNNNQTSRTHSERWDEMFEALQQHKTEHGHADVSTTDEDNRKLGGWVSTQRKGYRNYKAGNKQRSYGMCEERIKNLESIDFNWVSEAACKKRNAWDEMFEELKLFKAKYGHADVSTTDEDNRKLGQWVSNQRTGYRNYKAGNKQKSGGMCEERINQLENIDFKWTVK